MNCQSEYTDRLLARQQTHEQLRHKDDQVVQLRVMVFVIGLIFTWAVFGSWQLPWMLLLLPVGLFVAVVFYHESVQRKLRAIGLAIEYYQRCLNRLDGLWSEVGPTGEEFCDPQHPYTDDLDIFGTGSLFQLLGSPVTPAGSRTLAEWLAPGHLQELPLSDIVIGRQEAVRNLRDQLDLRERLAVIGRSSQSLEYTQELPRWLANAGGLTALRIRVLAVVLGVLGVGSLALWFFTYFLSVLGVTTLALWVSTISKAVLFLVVIAQLVFLRRLRGPLDDIKQTSERAVEELRRIEQVLVSLENIESEDAELKRLRSELIHDSLRASEAIHKIKRLVSQFENIRRNLFTAPLAFLSMGDLLLACAIDRWRAKHITDVDRWFRAMGELETLLAFAQFHYENPSYCFPELVPEPPQFIATQLAHPLLPPGTAVANDVELSEKSRMLLVSGSNMSGKSTLLRSAGINAVLAWAGAPVCAQSLKISRLQIAAAMRAQDSLQTGTSHFMATLKRIRQVVELAEQNSADAIPVLFLLDEILHGTNSHDRLVGARGVIRSLLRAGAIGLVTTHDLALSDMIGDLGSPTRNVHFCDEWENGKMIFDYQMHDGVVPKSNALSLMRLLGLEV